MEATRQTGALAAAFAGLSILSAACRTTDGGAKESPGAPAMSQEEMMAKMVELGTPGEAHLRLRPIIGTFEAKGQFWMDPSAPPTTSGGTTTNSWIMGGRFVQQTHEGSFMGQPFQGLGLTGYNNATNEYEAVWVDSMGTFIMPVSTGTCDAAGKVFTFSREFTDPLTGQPTKTREVVTIVDDDHHSFEWFQTGPGGKEARMMRIDYTRK